MFENVLVAAVFGAGRPIREAGGGGPGRRRPGADPPPRPRQRPGRRWACCRASGSSSPAPGHPALCCCYEIAGGLTDGEVLDLIDNVKALRSEGMTIVWIEHVVHALLAVVDHMVAMSFGRKIAEGDPDEVMASPAVREVYMGVEPE